MQNDYWLEKWKVSDTRFNLSQPHESLSRYLGSLKPSVVFVPLCGKSVDMKWLLDRGHEVIGVELSDIACRAFFTENQLTHSERIFTTIDGSKFTIFEGPRITIWCGDFFALPFDALQSVEAIYDRAALIALAPQLRANYATYLCDFVNRYANPIDYLLVTVEYEQSKVEGPPFSVSRDEVYELFDADFSVESEELIADDALSLNPKFRGVKCVEKVYLLKTKMYKSESPV